ncbi:MAG: hypothetical protein H7Z17_16885, partial [Fuerstia sp.]|nr:hypothetical protein [Fuerstiella sp.]
MNDEPVSPREVNPAVDVDLETIVLKCLSKEPDQRYPSALAISQDLAAFLDGRTISARPASTWDRLIRWRRRNPAIALWMSVAGILLVVGTIVSSTLAIMESWQRAAAEFNEGLANEKKTLAEKKEAEAVELAARLRNSLAVVEQQRKQARRDAFTSSISASFAYLQNAEPERIGDRLDRLQLSDAEIDDAGFEFRYLHRQANLRPRMIPAHTASAEAVAFSPDGKIIASGGQDFVAELWSSENGEHLRTLYASHDPVTALAFSPDSKHLVAGTQDTGLQGHETRVDVWDYNTGTLVTTLPHHCSVHRLVFSLNGQYLITATADPDELGELRIYRTSDWSLMKKLEGHKPGNAGHIWGIADVAILWDNKQLASAGFEGKVKLWDIENGVEVRTLSGHSGWVRSVAFDSTGKSVVSGSDDHTIRFWDTQNGQQTRIFRDGVGITTTMAFDRRYRSLITASQLGLLKWDLQSGQAVSLGSPRAVNSIGFSPDGRMLAAARPDGMLEIWDYEAAGKSLPLEHSGWSSSVAFSDDGTILASGSGRKSINVFDIQTRTLLYEIADQPHVVTDVWFSPKSRYLVSKCPNGSKNREDLRLWDA